MRLLPLATFALALVILAAMLSPVTAAEPKRVGIIGLDTSHCIAFTKAFNAAKPDSELAGFRVVAVYPKGSPDIESSTSRVPGYIDQMKKLDVKIVDSLDDLVSQVDCVLLETNDGRPHLEQALVVFKAKKPVFIDKPVAGSLADCIAIFEAAKKYGCPVFSSSALRFAKSTQLARKGEAGVIVKCRTTSPAELEKTHPDLFWYGIHGCESLFTVMGTGCESVQRSSVDGKIQVVGRWAGGREGTFLEGKGYSGEAVGKSTMEVGKFDGYEPLVAAIAQFFRTGEPPVPAAETIELYAFMEAADESKRQNGASVSIADTLAKARPLAAARLKALGE